jgi:hypothetical protein
MLAERAVSVQMRAFNGFAVPARETPAGRGRLATGELIISVMILL